MSDEQTAPTARVLAQRGWVAYTGEGAATRKVASMLPDGRVECYGEDGRLVKTKVAGETRHFGGERGKERLVSATGSDGGVRHYEGEKGEEVLVHVEFDDGSSVHCEGERGRERVARVTSPARGVRHYVGERGEERHVRTELPCGEVLHYAGDKGAERLVRTDEAGGVVAHYEGERACEWRACVELASGAVMSLCGPKGCERVVKVRARSGDTRHYEGEAGEERAVRLECANGRVEHLEGATGEEYVRKFTHCGVTVHLRGESRQPVAVPERVDWPNGAQTHFDATGRPVTASSSRGGWYPSWLYERWPHVNETDLVHVLLVRAQWAVRAHLGRRRRRAAAAVALQRGWRGRRRERRARRAAAVALQRRWRAWRARWHGTTVGALLTRLLDERARLRADLAALSRAAAQRARAGETARAESAREAARARGQLAWATLARKVAGWEAQRHVVERQALLQAVRDTERERERAERAAERETRRGLDRSNAAREARAEKIRRSKEGRGPAQSERQAQSERLAWLETDNELLRRHLDTAQEDAASWRSIAESWRGTVERSAGVGERERECVVCFERAATHALMPCGHRCLCETCSGRIMGGRAVSTQHGQKRPLQVACPLCNRPARGSVRIFDA